MMPRNSIEAGKQAQANADTFRRNYVTFQDTGGNWRIERESIGPKQHTGPVTVYTPRPKAPEVDTVRYPDPLEARDFHPKGE